ncbi:MAG: PQQ-binding-like beta-propeller repeat protein [Armatimonadetes bacterium]|nr:PQQ-binding-like beta-propeller repeat protein [Armatimonadota bacterium]
MTHRPLLSLPRLALCILIACSLATADDWPGFLGKDRTASWNETGILRQFPADGLKVTWRAPIGAGYGGPAVADGRVFVGDAVKRDGATIERVVCLDEKSGQVLWTYENPSVDYSKFAYNTGPRTTPTVDGDRVVFLGAAGDLHCLKAKSGDRLWHVNLPARYGAKIAAWGYAGSPLVYDNVLITGAGGPEARLVGLDKLTGQEVWHALPTHGDIGYGSPIIVHDGGVDQLISYTPGEVASLNPQTGQVYWQIPFAGVQCCATPAFDAHRLLVTNFYTGSALIMLVPDQPAAVLAWKFGGQNEANTEGLHGLMCSPVLGPGHFYGVCSYGQFRCLDASNGHRVWESLDVTRENKRWATAFMVRNGDVYFINNDRGELIIADVQPDGYHELSRTQLIAPTSGGAGGRELGKVNWVNPAYANRHIITRNDEEIIRASLAK